MLRIASLLVAAALLAFSPAHEAAAQNNTLGGAIIGGGIGAVVGGAATNSAGGAVAGGIIGAAAGAMIGSQFEPRRGGYYWYDGRCWRKYRDGSYHRVSRSYCG